MPVDLVDEPVTVVQSCQLSIRATTGNLVLDVWRAIPLQDRGNQPCKRLQTSLHQVTRLGIRPPFGGVSPGSFGIPRLCVRATAPPNPSA